MGLFFYTKKGSIISTVDLPTTEIIEPIFKDKVYINIVMSYRLIFIRSNDKIFFFAPQLFENLI